MRVLQVLNSYEFDGPGNLVLRICERLSPEPDLELAVVSIGRGGPARDRYAKWNIAADVIPARTPRGLQRFGQWLEHLMQGPSRPDVVHTHLLWPDMALRMLRKRLDGVPLLSTNHGMHASRDKGALLGLAYESLERATRQRHDGWVAVSESVRREMQAAGFPAERIETIVNGVDALRAYPRPEHRRAEIRWMMGVEPETPLIVAAGTLRPLKGHDVLLRAMPEVLAKVPDARLFLFGDGPSHGALCDLARGLGIERSVRVVRPLEETLFDVFSAADVVAHPSRIESFGLVVGEAGACGTPVVASRVGGIPEVIADGQTGFLIEPEDSGALARELSGLLLDAEKRNRMGQAARRHVVGNLEIGQTAAAYLRFWERHAGTTVAREPSAEKEEAPVGAQADS